MMSKFLSFGRVRNSSDYGEEPSNADSSSPVPGANSPYTDFASHINNGPTASRMFHHQYSPDPDERTHLLPPRSTYRRELLDPNDPAVSPYNLWTVRGLRWFSILFLSISIVWWTLLLISTFVSPPMMNSQGSGFYDFAFASVAVAVLTVVLLFFATPSRVEQYSCLVISFLLLFDAIIILVVGRIRVESGWVGIATVLWAAVMSAWAVLCDRIVEYGKQEEEARLTGRIETKRSLSEWLSVLASTILTVMLIGVTTLLTLTLILRAHDSSLAPPGTKYYVDSSKYQVHLFCKGNQTSGPTVFLEGGEYPIESGLLTWAVDAYEQGKIPRYCYWDRPGFAFSDNAPSPLSAGMAVDALSEALAQADEDGPWILASHGIGGIYSRIFASRHALEIKGLLLIDNVHESLLPRVASARRGFFLWTRGVLSPLGLDRLVGWIFQGRTREDRVYGRSAYQDPKFLKAKLQENLVASTFTKNEISSATTILQRGVPLVVVTSGRRVKNDKDWYRAQKGLTMITDELVGWDIVDKAPHEVWQTTEGKAVLEKRLGQLLNLTRPRDGTQV